MATINYYLDKANKKGECPIHLRINCNREQIKLSTKEKVKKSKFDKEKQLVIGYSKKAKAINHFLTHLKERAFSLLHDSNKKSFTNKEIKVKLNSIISAYRAETQVNIVKEPVSTYGNSYSFIDFFAGAGGFSEGFLQAEFKNKSFKFLLGSDINENCELTHLVRYNHQLGLDAEFLCQDITEFDFQKNLKERLKSKRVDVICGGPPCQSFSLAGKRRKFDKKDDLFGHYLEIIKAYQPKYFVMENVKGILTKEKGKIKDRIIEEIRSIIDVKEVGKLKAFIWELIRDNKSNKDVLEALIRRVDFERQETTELKKSHIEYIKLLDTKFKKLTPKIADYKTSKTDTRINTIRHGFNLLLRKTEIKKLQSQIIKERDNSYIDDDAFVNPFTLFIQELSLDSIVTKINNSFDDLKISKDYTKLVDEIKISLEIYTASFEGCIQIVKKYCNENDLSRLDLILKNIRLYNINKPFVANASDYGVPQNRERVLFIGCRKDQKFIETIPPTVTQEEKVTVFEALHDLDFIGNNEEAKYYENVDLKTTYNGNSETYSKLLKNRAVNGQKGIKGVSKYSDWSKNGRLPKRYKVAAPFYVKDKEALENGQKLFDELHNHKSSNQNIEVVGRLKVIIEKGGYKQAQESLKAKGLSSQKRNYNLLKPEGQSSTIMTIPDDYVHYNSPRALTVREMARLQSFDDSFVFQGKRSTGGSKRKTEVPQFTLVGNAVPPLLARAVAMEILKNIK
jgi:DNA (cytosine-5)-methyltransferase 1